MSHPLARRFAPAAALALALAFAPPAHAWPDPGRLTQHALQWLARLWPLEIPTPAAQDKAGGGIDPDGSPAPTSSTTHCTGGCELGPGIDPDG